MRNIVHTVLTGSCITLMAFALTAPAQEMPKTTTAKIRGASTVTTQELRGTVVFVEGNRLVVRMSTGDVRTFDVPESRRFIIDGKELTVSQLQPGTKLTAAVTTTTTPVTERTTTVGTGKVWWVSGNNVILTLPNNENHMYKVKESYRFIVNGQKATVHDLKKGMVVSAEKIVEEPRTEIASNTVVTGQAPPPAAPKKVEVAQARPRAIQPPPPAETPAPVHRPAPVATPAPVQQPEAPPAKLPKTASPLPLLGLTGLLLISGSFMLRRLRCP